MSTQRNFLLISSFAIVMPVIALLLPAKAHTNTTKYGSQHYEFIGQEHSRIKQVSILGMFRDWFDPPEVPGNRDPQDFCMLSPNPGMYRDALHSFSTLPVFAWYPSDRNIDRITISDLEATTEVESLETLVLNNDDNARGYIFYSPDYVPLERDTLYRVTFWYDHSARQKADSADFYVLSESSDQYLLLLPQLEDNPNVQAETREQARMYGKIFADTRYGEGVEYTNLWMDVARQVLSVPDLATEFIEAEYQRSCTSSQEMARQR